MRRVWAYCLLIVAGAEAATACELPASLEISTLRPVKPVETEATIGFGRYFHPVLGIMRQHDGVDFPAPIGEIVTAALRGRVVEVKHNGAYGRFIRIDHGGGIATSYAHLSRYAPAIEPGTCVKPGDVIGHVGNSGLTERPKLHFELRRDGVAIDPAPLLGISVKPPDEPRVRWDKL
jgi:murein DD-endopeptidase MepM/ murein hydrolase activator NlpD